MKRRAKGQNRFVGFGEEKRWGARETKGRSAAAGACVAGVSRVRRGRRARGVGRSAAAREGKGRESTQRLGGRRRRHLGIGRGTGAAGGRRLQAGGELKSRGERQRRKGD